MRSPKKAAHPTDELFLWLKIDKNQQLLYSFSQALYQGRMMSITNGATAEEVSTEVENPLQVALSGYRDLATLRNAAKEAVRAMNAGEDKLRKDLVQLLGGKTIEITGPTETEESYGQSEIENAHSITWLRDKRVVVTDILITKERFTLTDAKSPLIHAVYEDALIKRRFAGGLSFRLVQLHSMRIVEPAEALK